MKRIFTKGDWTIRHYPPAKKSKLHSPWLGPYLVVSIAGWAVGELQPDFSMLFAHYQDLKKIPRPRGLVSWLPTPDQPELGASTVGRSASGSAASSVTGLSSAQSLPRSSSVPVSGSHILPLLPPISIGPGHVLHPFSVNLMHLTTISLCYGMESKKAESSFLDDVSLPWRCVCS